MEKFIDLCDFFTVIYGLEKYRISLIENIVLFLILKLIQINSDFKWICLFTQYWLIDKSMCIYTLIHIEFYKIFLEVCNNFLNICKMGFLVLLLIVSLILVHQNISQKLQKINLSRKLFHFLLFLFYFSSHEFFISLTPCMFLCVVLLSTSEIFNSMCLFIKSKRDINTTILLSPIYLLASCTIPYYYLSSGEYTANLVSVCVLDSVTSIVGVYYGKNDKSFIGSLVGVITSIFVFNLLEQQICILYFILIGLIEYFDFYNDNISITVFSLIYFKIIKCI